LTQSFFINIMLLCLSGCFTGGKKMRVSVLILAAGQGTRMHSSMPKVLHHLAGKPFIRYSVETAYSVTSQKPVVVIGHEAEAIRSELGNEVEFVYQMPQLGTGHAVMMAEEALKDKADLIAVIHADMPLVTAETLKNMISVQAEHKSVMTLLSIHSDVSRGYGRIIRNEHGEPQSIIEEQHATAEQLALRELNAAVYCFDAAWLWQALRRVELSEKGEYYLTDMLEIAVREGSPVQVYSTTDPDEAVGINNRVHLADAERMLRKRVNTAWMLSGVTMIDPEHTYIEPGVQIGQDTIIYPNTYLRGKTVVGKQCVLGPNAILDNTQIGDDCHILNSVLEGAILENNVEIGPFGHLRKGTHLADGVHLGNFGEIKNSYLGPDTKMGHFSYIGDAQIGANVNIGAGTITCNYDGVKKHKTVIEDNVFIGSDTMLVAPVKLEQNARTGAGAVVTHDVAPDTTVVGVPARPLIKKGKSE
jgi:bifunctional UDP-N-acetylglucosamine pyrophosphorylase / glucosamine-1-phosphate N-acetyltransferase